MRRIITKIALTCAIIFFIIPTLALAKAELLINKNPNLFPDDQQLKLMQGQGLYDLYPWSVMYYYGQTVTDPLARIFNITNLDHWPEHIQAIEFAHTLDKQNFLRRFFNPVVGVVQLAGVATIRQGFNEPPIYEVDPYIGFRWANMPWNDYLNTSFAIGEGISYASSVPSVERRYSNNTKRLLNFLMFEATFALPEFPQLQLVARIHHRSGAYGLYGAGNSGSNDLALGIRYLFN